MNCFILVTTIHLYQSLSVAAVKHHDQKGLTEEKTSWNYVWFQKESPNGREAWQQAARTWGSGSTSSVANTKQSVNQTWDKARQTHNLLPILCFLQQGCTAFPIGLSSRDQVFKHMSLWGVFSFKPICLDLVSKAEFLLFAYVLYIHRSSMDQHLGSLYLVSILNKNSYEHWSTSTFASLYFHYFWSVYLKKLLDCAIILRSIFFLFYLLISGNILTISYFCTTHWDHIHYTAFSYSPHASVLRKCHTSS